MHVYGPKGDDDTIIMYMDERWQRSDKGGMEANISTWRDHERSGDNDGADGNPVISRMMCYLREMGQQRRESPESLLFNSTHWLQLQQETESALSV